MGIVPLPEQTTLRGRQNEMKTIDAQDKMTKGRELSSARDREKNSAPRDFDKLIHCRPLSRQIECDISQFAIQTSIHLIIGAGF